MIVAVAVLIIQLIALTGLLPLPLAGVYLPGIVINLFMTSLVFFALIQQLDLQRLEKHVEVEEDRTG